MDWDEVVSKSLVPLLRSIVEEARGRFPGIYAGAGPRKRVGGQIFDVIASFTHDPSSEHEDLLFFLVCASNGALHLAPGGRSFFPDDGAERHVLRATIERGTGRELAALDPILLDPDPDSAEYAHQATEYVERTVAFVEANRALIFEALADREWQDPGD